MRDSAASVTPINGLGGFALVNRWGTVLVVLTGARPVGGGAEGASPRKAGVGWE